MSALAARRAAQLGRGDPPASSANQKLPVRAVSNPSTPSISSEESQSEDSEQEIEAGPSKRVRYAASPTKPRYYAPPKETDEPAAFVANPAKSVKRKRAYSPGAPVGSDSGDDSSAAEATDELPTYAPGTVNGSAVSTPYGTPGPSRVRSGPEASDVASSNFAPRRGVNAEIISRAGLLKAGLTDVSGQGVIISIAPQENISLAGVFCLIPLQRSIEIFSTALSPSADLQRRHPVFAPISHPLPNISAPQISKSAPSPLLSRLSLPSHFDRSPSRSIFLILEHQTGVEGMRAGAIPGFNTVWGDEKGWLGLKGIHAVPGSLLATCYPYISPPSWSSALDSLTTPKANGHRSSSEIGSDTAHDCPVVLVKGPKRSGKSTLARAALNVLLHEYAKVAWLECDLGQGEFGCGGVIGLWILDQPVFGPSFTHLRIPDRAHLLGTYTPLTCPDQYIAAISHLLQHYKYEIQYPSSSNTRSTSSRRLDTVPLVINTQGWVKGLGEELLRTLEGLAQASHVFAFDTPAEDIGDRQGWTSSPTLPAIPLPLTSTGQQPIVHSLEPAPASALQARYTAIDHRMVSTLSYFYALSSDTTGFLRQWEFSTPLIAVPPYDIVLGESIKAVYIIGEGADGILLNDLQLALNGSMIALLEVQHIDPDVPIYEQNRPLPPLDDVNFLGFALIRAVNPSSSPASNSIECHLLTPVPVDVLIRANAIAKNGAMELPTPGMLDWRDRGEEAQGVAGVPWGEVPYFDIGTGGVGVERRRWRRNLMRKGM